MVMHQRLHLRTLRHLLRCHLQIHPLMLSLLNVTNELQLDTTGCGLFLLTTLRQSLMLFRRHLISTFLHAISVWLLDRSEWDLRLVIWPTHPPFAG